MNKSWSERKLAYKLWVNYGFVLICAATQIQVKRAYRQKEKVIDNEKGNSR